jgi:hypothetical protein
MPMPVIQAVLRRQLESAASGNARAQRDILAMIRDIERARSIASLCDNDGADDIVDDTDDADANDVDDTADADRDDAGNVDDNEPTRQPADGIATSGERRQEEREPAAPLAVSASGGRNGEPLSSPSPSNRIRQSPNSTCSAPKSGKPDFGWRAGVGSSPRHSAPRLQNPTRPRLRSATLPEDGEGKTLAVSAPRPEDAAAPPAGRTPSRTSGTGSGRRRGVAPRRNGPERSAGVQPARPRSGRRRRGPAVNAGKIREGQSGSSRRSPGWTNAGRGPAQAEGGHARAPAAPAERDEKLKTRC